MNIPEAKAAVDQEWENFEKIPAWQLTKVRNKKEVIAEARKEGKTVHFPSLMDICHLKNAEMKPTHQKYKGPVVLRSDIVKDDSGSCAVFAEQGSSASQMTAAKVMDVKAGLRGCARQAAHAVSACSQVKIEDVPSLFLKNSKVRMSSYLETSTETQMAGPAWKTQWFLLCEICMVIFWQDYYGKHGWGKVPTWRMLISNPRKRRCLAVYVDDLKLAGKKHNVDPMWKN